MIVRSSLLALSWGMFSVAPLSSSYLPPQYLPAYGGSGGTAFSRSCGTGKVMTGVRFRAGFQVDAVGLLCRPVQSDGTLAGETAVGTMVGGGGGTFGTRSCPTGKVVKGQTIYYGTYVDGFYIVCRNWNAGTRTFGPSSSEVIPGQIGRIGGAGSSSASKNCEAAGQPAQGIHGRAHSLVDAIGFVCNEP